MKESQRNVFQLSFSQQTMPTKVESRQYPGHIARLAQGIANAAHQLTISTDKESPVRLALAVHETAALFCFMARQQAETDGDAEDWTTQFHHSLALLCRQYDLLENALEAVEDESWNVRIAWENLRSFHHQLLTFCLDSNDGAPLRKAN